MEKMGINALIRHFEKANHRREGRLLQIVLRAPEEDYQSGERKKRGSIQGGFPARKEKLFSPERNGIIKPA